MYSEPNPCIIFVMCLSAAWLADIYNISPIQALQLGTLAICSEGALQPSRLHHYFHCPEYMDGDESEDESFRHLQGFNSCIQALCIMEAFLFKCFILHRFRASKPETVDGEYIRKRIPNITKPWFCQPIQDTTSAEIEVLTWSEFLFKSVAYIHYQGMAPTLGK